MAKPQQTLRVFVIEAEGQGIVAFEAASHREASEIRKEQWFRDELALLQSNNNPIWDGKASLSVRIAEPTEALEYKRAESSALNRDRDELFLAYLIPLDRSV